jgi:glycine betaine/proline transport system substrate-binding protein
MRTAILSLLGACLLAVSAAAAEPAGCRTVRLAANDWTDMAATTALAAELYRGLDYTPRTTTLPVPAIYAAMGKGQADGFLGNWMPGMADERQPDLDDHSVTVLGANLTGAKLGLAVPDYLYDMGLHDFADIARFGAHLNHRILAIEEGSDSSERLLELIHRNAFGLGDFELVQSSEAKLLADVAHAEKLRQPVVFLAWQPHWMDRDLKPHYLAGGEAVFGPDTGAASVFTNARTEWLASCPNAARLLRKLVFALPAVDEMMAAIRTQRRTPDHAALDWLRANPGALAGWLDGVESWDGKPGEASVRAKLGISG